MSYAEAYKSLPFFQVNAFTEDPFKGNPAAVVPLAEWPDDALLQRIASENNVSETAFFTPVGEKRSRLRWFTPTTEVDLCGHATLASAFVILNILRPDLSAVEFETRAGLLKVRRGGSGFLVMDFPSYPPKPVKITKNHEALVGKRPREILTSGMNLMLIFEGGEKEILGLEPNFAAMAKFPEYGFVVTSRGASADFVSRYFAPNHGVPEDPVTGSAHCTSGPYWAEKLGTTRLTARQISTRGGDLVLELKGDRIDIWGQCFLVKEGALHLTKRF